MICRVVHSTLGVIWDIEAPRIVDAIAFLQLVIPAALQADCRVEQVSASTRITEWRT